MSALLIKHKMFNLKKARFYSIEQASFGICSPRIVTYKQNTVLLSYELEKKKKSKNG